MDTPPFGKRVYFNILYPLQFFLGLAQASRAVIFFPSKVAGVAQLVEQLIRNQ